MKVNFGILMRQIALRHGEREALVNVERGRRYTFTEFHRLTNRIANAMRGELGITKGDRFLLILENDNLALMQFPTFLKQEGTAVMTNLRDSVDEQRWQVELTRPKVAFIETALIESHASMLSAAGCKVVAMDPPSAAQREAFPNIISFAEMVEAASEDESDVVLEQERDIVLMRFTGGTTGRGKCATYTLDNWFAGRDSSYINGDLGFDAETRFLHAAPLSHGTQLFMYPTVFSGGASVTMNNLDLEEFRSVLEAERITHSFLVPTVLYRLLDRQREDPRSLGSLKTLIYGAAPMSPTKLEQLIGCFGLIFAQAYAATEAVSVVSLLDKKSHIASTEMGTTRLSSAGLVTPGIEVIITDDSGLEVPMGEVGEIRIRSRGIIPGYYSDPEATAKEFADGAWRSGDLGYIDQGGFLFIVDRLKDMIISGGFNVYAVEVEAALAAHPAVLHSAVIGLPHLDWGEAVHAEVQLREGSTATDSELIAHVKERLGSYKAPKTVTFVDALPLTVVGKVLRRKVRDKYRPAASGGKIKE